MPATPNITQHHFFAVTLLPCFIDYLIIIYTLPFSLPPTLISHVIVLSPLLLLFFSLALFPDDGYDDNPGLIIAVGLVLRYVHHSQALRYLLTILHHSPSNAYPLTTHSFLTRYLNPPFILVLPPLIPYLFIHSFISFHSGSPSKPVAATNWRQPCRSINQKINQTIALACHIHADTNPTHAKSHTQTHIQ